MLPDEAEYHNPQTYVEGKGNVYCGVRDNRSERCPRHPNGFKFPGKKKCDGCFNAKYENK